MSYEPSFAIITTREIGELAKRKASASTILVYTCLLTYAQDKVTCFPKVETIRKRLHNAYSIASIMRALKWLCDFGFLKRKERRSKERFTLLKRVAKRVAEAMVSNPSDTIDTTSHICDRKKTKRKNSFFKRGKKKFLSSQRKKVMGYGRFGNSQNEANNEPVCKAEHVYADWLVKNDSMCVTTLSPSQTSIITETLRSQAPVDKEWREMMSWCEKNKAVFDALLISSEDA